MKSVLPSNEQIVPNAVYSSEQVAKIFGLNIQTVQKMAREGKINCFTIGRDYRFTGQDILDFVNTARVKKGAI